MNESVLDQVLSDWSYWDKPPPPSVERRALSSITDWTGDLVWVIRGVRRCGKSTLLAQLMRRFSLEPARCFFVNFEDPRLSRELTYHLLDRLVRVATERVPRGERYFFLDEIQNVEGWERWLNLQVERPGANRFVVTGSNASLLGGKLGTALTGRHRTLELFPFDWREYALARPGAGFESYLASGGFPRSLSVPDPKGLLREYFTDIIERDVRRHVSARSSLTLMQLARAIFESAGSETSLRKLAALIDSTADTVRTYVDAFRSAYLVLPCPFFTFSERKRAVRPVKIYPIDLGLRDAVVSTPLPDRGKKLETVAYHALRRKFGEVFYWRGKGEVDFVVLDGTRPLPVQVTWDDPKPRHRAALEEFRSEFPNAGEPWILNRGEVGRLE
jgi:hypothetical protein